MSSQNASIQPDPSINRKVGPLQPETTSDLPAAKQNTDVQETPSPVTSNSSGTKSTSQNGQNRQSDSATSDRSQNKQERQDKQKQDGQSLEGTVQLLNEMSDTLNREVKFNIVDDETIQASLKNSETDEVIREIPPDEVIEVRKRIDAFLGLFVDELR